MVTWWLVDWSNRSVPDHENQLDLNRWSVVIDLFHLDISLLLCYWIYLAEGRIPRLKRDWSRDEFDGLLSKIVLVELIVSVRDCHKFHWLCLISSRCAFERCSICVNASVNYMPADRNTCYMQVLGYESGTSSDASLQSKLPGDFALLHLTYICSVR